jgi:hypothetical protein
MKFTARPFAIGEDHDAIGRVWINFKSMFLIVPLSTG